MSLHAAAFVLMATAGALIVVSGLGHLQSLGLLRISAWISAAAIVAAVASVLLPSRWPRRR